MKRIEQFKCDHCGVLYADKSECAKCEEQHVMCKRIHKQLHLARKVCAKYPPKIHVEMDDGTIQEYERRRQI